MIEGAPGYEHSFLRRALDADPGIEVDAVVRKGKDEAGKDTFYIQASRSRAEALTSGYPLSPAALFAYDGAVTRAVQPVPGESYGWPSTGACMANPGAVCGNPRDAASWWLIVDTDAHALQWHRKE